MKHKTYALEHSSSSITFVLFGKRSSPVDGCDLYKRPEERNGPMNLDSGGRRERLNG
jgi:hypothetical protein